MIQLKAVTQDLPLQDENGKEITYKISKISAADRESYLNKLSKRYSDPDPEGQIHLLDYVGLRADLLVQCLRDPSGKLVPFDTIQSWPDEAVGKIHDIAKEFNNLEGGDTDAKND
jgi:hypothetical protein